MSLHDTAFFADNLVCIVSMETLVWWKDVFAYVYPIVDYGLCTYVLWCGVIHALLSYLDDLFLLKFHWAKC